MKAPKTSLALLCVAVGHERPGEHEGADQQVWAIAHRAIVEGELSCLE